MKKALILVGVILIGCNVPAPDCSSYRSEIDSLRKSINQAPETLKVILEPPPEPLRKSLIRVYAYGSICEELYPNLEIEINNNKVRTLILGPTMYGYHEFNVDYHYYEINTVGLTFSNDCYHPEIGEDRNVWIKSVKINEDEIFNTAVTLPNLACWTDTGLMLPGPGTVTINYEAP